MTKKIFIFAVLMYGLPALAQSEPANMASALRSMPDNILELLTHNNILDFIDFRNSNMKAEVDNKLGGRSEMTDLTDSTCHIRLTSSSEADISIVSRDGTPSILVRRTYNAGKTTSTSQARYTLDWKKEE